MPVCNKCLIEQPEENFFFSNRRTGRRFKSCKGCRKKYVEANKDSVNASKRRWESRNKEKFDAARRRWAQRNKARVRQNTRRYRRRNKLWARECCRRRQVVRKGAGGCHSILDWQLIMHLQDGCCAYCGEERTLTRDHVVPITRGGTDDAENIVGACRSCNAKKNNRTPAEFAFFILRNAEFCRPGLIDFAISIAKAAFPQLTAA